jgi:two-component system chemotaxis sensor kinase CheA
MDEIVAEFLVETHESLDRLDRDLLLLERNPGSADVLAGIFRTMHTIKGTCGFLGFARLERVAHAAESLLAALRDRALVLTPTIAGALLATGDVLRVMVARIEATGSDGEDDHADLVGELERLRTGAPAPASGERGPAPAAKAETAPERDGTAATRNTVRVDVALLDELMTLVGQLVLARNRLMEVAAAREEPELTTTSLQVSSITTELQARVMQTRLQPIGTAWAKFPRIVRDLATSLGKEVRIDARGGDTELDRSILEAIGDPLTHLVRNAVDHGIEPPDVRDRTGKAREGVLAVRAYQDGGQVGIEIADDGAGIDLGRLTTAALARGMLAPDAAARMSEREILELIFRPGFSTADHVSTVSGRGVGMDVVRTNVERLGGSVEVTTEPGRGTTFKIRIPLTLAIVAALLVEAGGRRYAIPQVDVQELVRIDAGDVERVYDVPVVRLRERLLPLVDLGRTLGLAADAGPGVLSVLVLRAEDQRFGLIVSAVGDPGEVVVKPLGAHLAGSEVFAGATILGDGTVSLILDVVGLARRAGITEAAAQAPAADPAPEPVTPAASPVLVFADPAGNRMAVPVEIVDRVLEIPPGTGDALRLTGGSLPLITLADLLGRRPVPGPAPHALVHRHRGAVAGIVVGTVLDVVDPLAEPEIEVLDLPALLDARAARRGAAAEAAG